MGFEKAKEGRDFQNYEIMDASGRENQKLI